MTTTKRNPSDLGYIEDRWMTDDGTQKARYGQGRRYRARWVDDDGRERAASFASEKAAKAHLTVGGSRRVRKPQRTQSRSSEFYNQWSVDQPWVAGTRVKTIEPSRRLGHVRATSNWRDSARRTFKHG